MQGIESVQMSATSQAVSATPSLNEVLTYRVMSTHIFILRIFFQNILETRTFLKHITHRVCFYGIKHCLLRSKTRHFCIFKKNQNKFQHTFWDLEFFSANFLNTRTCKVLNQHKGVRLHRRFLLHPAWTKCSPSVSCQHTFLDLIFFKIFMKHAHF